MAARFSYSAQLNSLNFLSSPNEHIRLRDREGDTRVGRGNKHGIRIPARFTPFKDRNSNNANSVEILLDTVI